MPNKGAELTINYDKIESDLLTNAEIGLSKSAEVLLQRAKKYAPVRDIFQRGRRPGKESVPRGIQKRKRYKYQHKVFGRKLRHHQDSTRDRFMAQVKAQMPKTHRIGHGVKGTKRIEGTSRGLYPFLRMRDREGNPLPGRVEGDFRRARIDGGNVSLEGATVKNPRTGKDLTVDSERFLSYQGRQELKHIRKLAAQAQEAHKAGKLEHDFESLVQRSSLTRRKRLGIGDELTKAEKLIRRRGLHADASGEVRVGGRLRDEIYATEVFRKGSKLYVDVVSPTEYAKYQEYGSSHNRAQPYMRPALYDMRGRFRTIVSRSMRSGGSR